MKTILALFFCFLMGATGFAQETKPEGCGGADRNCPDVKDLDPSQLQGAVIVNGRHSEGSPQDCCGVQADHGDLERGDILPTGESRPARGQGAQDRQSTQ